MRRQDRHITCVKMSQDKADEVSLILPAAGYRTLADSTGDLCVRRPFDRSVLDTRRPLFHLRTSAVSISYRYQLQTESLGSYRCGFSAHAAVPPAAKHADYR